MGLMSCIEMDEHVQMNAFLLEDADETKDVKPNREAT